MAKLMNYFSKDPNQSFNWCCGCVLRYAMAARVVNKEGLRADPQKLSY